MNDYDEKQEASDERTLPARLRALATHYNDEVRYHVALNPSTPVPSLLVLGQEFPSQLLKNPLLPILLLEDPNFLLTIPDETLLSLLCAYDVPLMLVELAVKHPNTQTQCFLASNKETPDHILDRLSRSSSEVVRECVATNPRAPLRALLWLLGDAAANIRASAKKNPALAGSRVFSLIDRLRVWPTEGGRLPEEALIELIKCGTFIQQQVASYCWVSPSILAALAEEEALAVRFAVVCHMSTSSAVLEKLSRDVHPQVREYAHRHLAHRADSSASF